jgi:hypothetical protein
MSSFRIDDTRMPRPRGADLAGTAPLSEQQEVQLAAEALEILGDKELEEFLGNMLSGVAAGAGRGIRPAVARQLGGALKGVATALLPGGDLLGSPMAPRPREGAGSKLGQMVDGLLELELEGLDREGAELERARRFVGLAATSARQAALAPHDVPPRHVVQTALARSLEEHVPELLERALDGEAENGGAKKPPDGGRRPPKGGHRSTKRGKSRRGVHEGADERRAREQAAAEARRKAQAKKKRPPETPEVQRLKRELAALKNQMAHAKLQGDYQQAGALQSRIHELSTALARLVRGEQELEGMEV